MHVTDFHVKENPILSCVDEIISFQLVDKVLERHKHLSFTYNNACTDFHVKENPILSCVDEIISFQLVDKVLERHKHLLLSPLHHP